MAQAGLPNFFIVGAQNSGTTSLYYYLKQHPEIFLPALKEPHYFAQIRPAYQQRYLYTFITTERDYIRLFRRAAGYSAIGEASPSYLWASEAPTRIHRMVPEARIIILLRDPVERAYSHYLMDLREGLQRLPFFEALQGDWRRERKGWGISRLYVELGLYSEQVRRYMRMFGASKVKIILFDDLCGTPKKRQSALEEMVRFLGVDPVYLDQINTSFTENRFGVARWNWARQLAGSNWGRRIGQIVVPRSIGSNHTIKRLIFQPFFVKDVPRPTIDPAAGQWLRTIYEPDLQALEELLDRPMLELRRSWPSREPATSPTHKVAV